jgi:hypothetical protein
MWMWNIANSYQTDSNREPIVGEQFAVIGLIQLHFCEDRKITAPIYLTSLHGHPLFNPNHQISIS